MMRDMKKISWTEGNGILFPIMTFESGGSRNEVAIDIVFSMVMPARSRPRLTSCANYQIIFAFEGEMSADAWARWGFCEIIHWQGLYL